MSWYWRFVTSMRMANVGDETDVHGIRTVLEGQEERE